MTNVVKNGMINGKNMDVLIKTRGGGLKGAMPPKRNFALDVYFTHTYIGKDHVFKSINL